MKATQGDQGIDSRFVYNFTHAREQGIKAIPYHVYSYQDNGSKQINHIYNVLKQVGDIRPAVLAIDIDSIYRHHDQKRHHSAQPFFPRVK
ncbi:GH25 family lysozyme [Piscirickettsia litoralis]|nr:GH25 family lysozyme [Piscirickettsia litoralis]